MVGDAKYWATFFSSCFPSLKDELINTLLLKAKRARDFNSLGLFLDATSVCRDAKMFLFQESRLVFQLLGDEVFTIQVEYAEPPACHTPPPFPSRPSPLGFSTSWMCVSGPADEHSKRSFSQRP